MRRKDKVIKEALQIYQQENAYDVVAAIIYHLMEG